MGVRASIYLTHTGEVLQNCAVKDRIIGPSLHKIVSLWIMMRAMRLGELLELIISLERLNGSLCADDYSGCIPDSDRANLLLLLARIAEVCESLELPVSVDLAKSTQGSVPYPLNIHRAHTLIEGLSNGLKSECSTVMFLKLDPNHARLYYEQEELFGAEVATRFSKAAFNIKEAGNCYVLERWTACVFHLMCVLEVGLDSLAHALNLPYSEKNWNVILKEIEDAIAAIDPKVSSTWKQDKEFYSHAALEFKFFRDAWRNHTMHARAKYTEAEAKLIFDHVKAFIVHLSTKLTERP